MHPGHKRLYATHQIWNLAEKRIDFQNGGSEIKKMGKHFGNKMVDYLEEKGHTELKKLTPTLGKQFTQKDCANFVQFLIDNFAEKEIIMDDRDNKKINKSNCDLIINYFYMKYGEEETFKYINDYLFKTFPKKAQDFVDKLKEAFKEKLDDQLDQLQIQEEYEPDLFTSIRDDEDDYEMNFDNLIDIEYNFLQY